MKKIITTATLVAGMIALALPALAAPAQVNPPSPPAGDLTIDASLDVNNNGGITFVVEASVDLATGEFTQSHCLTTPGHTSGDLDPCE